MAKYKVTFLGTMAYRPTRVRSVFSTFVKSDDLRLMIDCGEGVQMNMLRAGINFGGETIVFISHRHAEHYLGLFGLALSMRMVAPESTLSVFAEKSTLDRLEIITKALDNRLIKGLSFNSIQEGVFYETETTILEAFPLRHTVPCFGLIVRQRDHKPFLSDKADELNVPIGPQRKELAAGKSIVLSTGEIIRPEQVLGTKQLGRKIVFIQDTFFSSDLVQYCEDAACIVIEATYLQKDKALSEKWYHLTALEGAKIAKDARASRLFLTHLSHRYPIEDVLKEAKTVFSEAMVCEELECVTVDLSPVLSQEQSTGKGE